MPPLLLALSLFACDRGFADPSRAFAEPVPPDAPPYPVEIHRPAALGRLDTALTTATGAPVGIACATCHAAGEGPAIADGTGAPTRFHAAVEPAHGGLSCASCHDGDRTLLHLADGRAVEFGDAMVLCSQCHGPQRRDYDHGAHGGMSGSWDLRQGPRLRNNCLDCHAAHAPAYPSFLPTFPPNDRFFGDHHE